MSISQDIDNIKKWIEDSVGFEALNKQIQGQIRGWLVSSGEAVLNEWKLARGESDLEVLELTDRLGMLLLHQVSVNMQQLGMNMHQVGMNMHQVSINMQLN